MKVKTTNFLTFLGVTIIFLCFINNVTAQYNWSVYNTSNSSLPGDRTFAMDVDVNGKIWFGTSFYGLATFHCDTWKIYNTSNSGIPDNEIRSVAIDNNNIKYIGTNFAGFSTFDGNNWVNYNTSNSGLPHNTVFSIAVDNYNVKWLGTFSGLAKFDGASWTTYNQFNSGLSNNNVRALTIDNNNVIWIGTYSGGLVTFDGINWTVYNTSNSGLPHNRVSKIEIDFNGNKWIATRGGGAVVFDGNNWTVYNQSNSGLPDNNIWDISIDNNGIVWMSTFSGLVAFDGTNWTVYNMSNSSLPDNEVRTIVIGKHNEKWIGSNNGGVTSLTTDIKDIGINNLVTPSDSFCNSGQKNVQIILENYGNMLLNNFNVNAVISGNIQDTLSSVYIDNFEKCKLDTFTIGSFNTTNTGEINLQIYTSLQDDADRSNDTLYKTAFISPSPPTPDVQDESICQEGSVTLTGTNTNHLTNWYATPTSHNVIHTGPSYTTPNLSFTHQFYVENSTDHGCTSARKEVTVNVGSSLNAPEIAQGSIFEGTWNDGTAHNPDILCSDNTVVYEFPPPANYSNGDYGNQWSLSAHLKTEYGNPASNVQYSGPNGNNNAKLTFTGSASEADSTFKLSADYVLHSSQCNAFSYRHITIRALPEASFNLDNLCAHTTTSFMSTTTTGNIIDYHWDFGDGNTSSSMGTTHIYSTPGTFTIKHTVTSDAFCSDTEEKVVEIKETPQPDFTTSTQCTGKNISFNNLTSFPGGSQQLAYEWNFGMNNQTSTDFEPEFTYPNPGLYLISLNVSSANGCMNSINKQIEIFDSPVAEFEVDDVCAGIPAVFNNTSSGNNITSSWNFDDGNSSQNHSPVHFYQTPGKYDVKLNITDVNGCTDNHSSEINVFSLPNANFSIDQSGGATNFTPDNISHTSYSWDFGDGNNSTYVNPEHNYAKNGFYNVTLTVEDDNGCLNERTIQINVINVSIETNDPIKTLNLSIYPNPFSDETLLTYEVTDFVNVSIALYDLSGKKITSIENNKKPAGTYFIHLNPDQIGINEGMYLLKFNAGHESTVERIIYLE